MWGLEVERREDIGRLLKNVRTCNGRETDISLHCSDVPYATSGRALLAKLFSKC